MTMDSNRPSFTRRGLLAGLAVAPVLAAASRPLGAEPPAGETSGAKTTRSGAAAAQTTGAAAAADARLAPAALKDAKGTQLVMLGTGGGPVPGRRRNMTSHVILSGGAAYVLDCGLGVTNQFARTGIPFNAVRSVFITHHHPDHNVEYGPFLLIGWVQGMLPSVRAFGPPPLKQMTEDYLRSVRATIDFWSEDLKMKPLGMIDVQEVSAAGPVVESEGLKVTAAVVEHPPVYPALGYRFDFADRSIAFSGDTAPVEVLARLAKGADVLVHEAMYVPAVEAYVRGQIAKGRPVSFDAWMAHMKADHSPVEDVGRIAQEAGVKTLVLSHLTPAIDTLLDDTWRAEAAKHFKGEIIVAQDMLVV